MTLLFELYCCVYDNNNDNNDSFISAVGELIDAKAKKSCQFSWFIVDFSKLTLIQVLIHVHGNIHVHIQ